MYKKLLKVKYRLIKAKRFEISTVLHAAFKKAKDYFTRTAITVDNADGD